MRWLVMIVLVLAGVPGWSGIDRVPILSPAVVVRAHGWRPAGGWPARIGALRPIGALALSSTDPAFGGFSALSLAHGRALLLSDEGNYVALRIRGRVLTRLAAGTLPAGPGTGWRKEDRDSESLVEDARSGTMWVGFERANAIWRYAPGFAKPLARVAPRGMREWPDNGGAESLARLPDGRFVTIAESMRVGKARAGLLFAGDPTDRHVRPAPIRYVPPPRFEPSDAAALPNGDLLVLNRRFDLPFRFTTKLVRIPAATIRAGGTLHGRAIATLAAPVMHENCEGLALTREGGATIVWIATDNDSMPLRPSLLMKFRLDESAEPVR